MSILKNKEKMTLKIASTNGRGSGKTKQLLDSTSLVTPENYCGMEEWYIPVIKCPKCEHKVPAINSNYCSGCGVKLKLSTIVKKKSDSAW